MLSASANVVLDAWNLAGPGQVMPKQDIARLEFAWRRVLFLLLRGAVKSEGRIGERRGARAVGYNRGS